MIDRQELKEMLAHYLLCEYGVLPSQARPQQLHMALSRALMGLIAQRWQESERACEVTRRAHYFSAEFLVGRAIYNNLLCLNALEAAEETLRGCGASLAVLEETEDAALGNGGLGRLAACFLDSAATLNLPLDGYGIRYRYGLFRQRIEDGFQVEELDDWSRYGDPWSIRREQETVRVTFADSTVIAVPYDMPVVGYGTSNIGTLRLWQAEPEQPFDFTLFNEQRYDEAVAARNRAEDISRVLYPNDSTPDGKRLRLRQQYFFSSASLQDIIRKHKRVHGTLDTLAELHAVQLNDTHPVIAIPELIRLLTKNEGMPFEQAWETARQMFCYTNHTVMAEALEKWELALVEEMLPEIAAIILKIDALLAADLEQQGVEPEAAADMAILKEEKIHMAHLAVYGSRCVNGVAKIHTEILKNDVLKAWHTLWPERFFNKTNGITQRRWMALCNPELSALATRLLGGDGWKSDLSLLRGLEQYADDETILREFCAIKLGKKQDLAEYVKKHDNVAISPEWVLDVQIKRLHEYKRQLLNALAILHLYFELREGKHADFTPTVFLFGAKSAPGYARAKAIIKLIGEIGALIDRDELVRQKLQVVFVSNYNVSYAEKIVAAAEVSEQISLAGTEASGTGNMKLMLNGAVTLGTFDGANVEIVGEAGAENEYIFGATVEELHALGDGYDPRVLYTASPDIRRVLDALIDGTLEDDNTGMFRDLYDSILEGASWHKPDQYCVLLDFERYVRAKLNLNRDYRNTLAFARKGWLNMCRAGYFSSDRTIMEYAEEIWNIAPTCGET